MRPTQILRNPLVQACFLAAVVRAYPANQAGTSLPSSPRGGRLTIMDNFYGVRNVTYSETDSGLAIIDGDVVYGTVDELRAHEYSASQGDVFQNLVFPVPTAAWPNATIFYKYDSDVTEELLRSATEEAMRRWTKMVPYLKFTRMRPNFGLLVSNVITISNEPLKSCRSSVGYGQGTILVMNLIPENRGVGGSVYELGHALGLKHEHQHPDREQYVHYICENVAPDCSARCCDQSRRPSNCSGYDQFDSLSVSPIHDFSSPYDVNSVMHYGAQQVSCSKDKPVFVGLHGLKVADGISNYPSQGDVDNVCKMYAKECEQHKACLAAGCVTRCGKANNVCAQGVICGKDDSPWCCKVATLDGCQKKALECWSNDCAQGGGLYDPSQESSSL